MAVGPTVDTHRRLMGSVIGGSPHHRDYWSMYTAVRAGASGGNGIHLPGSIFRSMVGQVES